MGISTSPHISFPSLTYKIIKVLKNVIADDCSHANISESGQLASFWWIWKKKKKNRKNNKFNYIFFILRLKMIRFCHLELFVVGNNRLKIRPGHPLHNFQVTVDDEK